MNKSLPVIVRDSIEDIGDKVMGVFDRWLPEHWRHEHRTDMTRWPSHFFERGGPVLQLDETDDEVLATVEMPGFDKDEFKVEIEGQRLIVRGEKKASQEENRDSWHCRRSAYGSFYRAAQLPCEVEVDHCSASYKHGVLGVRMPKTAEARKRRTHIQVH